MATVYLLTEDPGQRAAVTGVPMAHNWSVRAFSWPNANAVQLKSG